MAGAALTRGRRLLAAATSAGVAGAPYQPALLALREGPLLEAAVRALPSRPDVLLVAVHAAWRTGVDTAVAVVLAATRRPARTPEPLRRARTAARVARATAGQAS
jgi:deoxyinosine 3'endonuclease (endonuclease V)